MLEVMQTSSRKKWLIGGLIGFVVVLVGAFAFSAVTESPYTKAIMKSDEIVLSEVADRDIAQAYVVCPYAEGHTFAELGFDPKSFYSIDNNFRAWETHSGLAIKYQDGSTEVVYFSPTEIDACSEFATGNPPELDPDATIRIKQVQKKFANPERDETVRVLTTGA